MEHHNAPKLQHFCCTSAGQISFYFTTNGRVSLLQLYQKKKSGAGRKFTRLHPVDSLLLLFAVFSHFAYFSTALLEDRHAYSKLNDTNIYIRAEILMQCKHASIRKAPKEHKVFPQKTVGKFSPPHFKFCTALQHFFSAPITSAHLLRKC